MIAQAAVRRRLIKASGDISELGYDESTTTQELLEKAEAELFSGIRPINQARFGQIWKVF